MEGLNKMTHAANCLDYQQYYDGDEVKATAGEHMTMLLDLLKNEIATFNDPSEFVEQVDNFKYIMEAIDTLSIKPLNYLVGLTWTDWAGFIIKEY